MSIHKALAIFLTMFSGWTISAHIAVLSGLNLKHLIIIAPVVIFGLVFFYIRLGGISPTQGMATRLPWPNILRHSNKYSIYVFAGICLATISLYQSWLTFWITMLSILTYCVLRHDDNNMAMDSDVPQSTLRENIIVSCLAIAAIIFTLAISRGDLDDAFYVAISAFSAGHPDQQLLAGDPMYGEDGLPLAFPSYRFASFELLSAAIAYLCGITAMDVIYKLLPPLWAVMSVFSIFLLAQRLMPKRWLLLGIITLAFTILLGEAHRGPANMMFVRLFQGKAVYYSIVLPAIYYLTIRYLSKEGTQKDLFLLGCSQFSAIGLSNFGMLAAPMAGFSALLSNAPIAMNGGNNKKLLGIILTLAIPLPYLIAVAIDSKWGTSITNYQEEEPFDVWRSVFGWRQQYLVASLLLIGPVLARDSMTRWRLAVPPIILFAIYLNPWLSRFISHNITSPPVYWRVTWSFPALIFLATSCCILMEQLTEKNAQRHIPFAMALLVMAGIILSMPFHTLRTDNIGLIEGFAEKKVSTQDYRVAERALQINGGDHRLLAPDKIAGILSRFEKHPKLVNVREIYLAPFASAFGSEGYRQRLILHDFVSGTKKNDEPLIHASLISLDVSTIVLPKPKDATHDVADFLGLEGYRSIDTINGYSIWHKASSDKK